MKSFFDIRPLQVSGQTDFPRTKPFRNNVFSFAFLMEGEVLVEVEGKNILISAGQFMIVPENKDIFIRHFNGCKGFDGCFSLDYLKDVSYPVLRSDKPIQQSFWFDDAVFMGSLLKRMYIAHQDKDKAFLQSALDLILSQLRPGGRVAVIPEKFLQLVFQRNTVPLSVSEYADLLQVTPNYLNKTVKNHTHRTAIDWIEIARVNLAKQLLKDPSLSIADIAEKTGLVDQSYFSRFFKKKTGMTPSQYRNNR